MKPVGFGVIGARSYVATRAVMPAIEAADSARLVATASAGGPVPHRWRSSDVGSYEAVIEHPDVDVVYLPLPNSLHGEWTIRAARAGKHVLCEKPLAPDAATAATMLQACRDAGVVLAEAWMTPFDPRWAAAIDLARSGVVGDIDGIDSTFTFLLDAATNYRWDPDHGGGALLDVGIYCLGAASMLWGTEPTSISAERVTARSGVDATTNFTISWTDGRRATGRCSFIEPERQRLVLSGDRGRLVVDGDAFTGGPTATEIIVEHADRRYERRQVESDDPYRRMIEAFTSAIHSDLPWYRPPERSVELLALLDTIAHRSAA